MHDRIDVSRERRAHALHDRIRTRDAAAKADVINCPIQPPVPSGGFDPKGTHPRAGGGSAHSRRVAGGAAMIDIMP